MSETVVSLHINGEQYDAEPLHSNGTPSDPYMTRVYYVAKDPQFGTPIILKEMVSNTLNATGREILSRAKQEARTMALVRNPHLPAIYEVIDSPPERIWLKIEYVNGRTLKDEFSLDSGVLPDISGIKELLRIAIEVGKALMAYHHHKIAHRDITPSNIMITNDRRTVKLIDIGIGALPRDYTWEKVGRVRIAGSEGTPGYQAPEQTASRDPLVGPGLHSDIFGLGAVLYRVLSGRTAALPPPTSARQVEPPSKYNAAVSPELDKLISQMLARQPRQRPKIGDVINELGRLRRGSQQ